MLELLPCLHEDDRIVRFQPRAMRHVTGGGFDSKDYCRLSRYVIKQMFPVAVNANVPPLTRIDLRDRKVAVGLSFSPSQPLTGMDARTMFLTVAFVSNRLGIGTGTLGRRGCGHAVHRRIAGAVEQVAFDLEVLKMPTRPSPPLLEKLPIFFSLQPTETRVRSGSRTLR